MKRKIIFNLAMSIDGYIADEQGGFNWIKGHGDSAQNTDKKFEFPKFLEGIDTIVMGRKSYEDCGITGHEDKTIIVASSQAKEDYDNVRFVSEDICSYVQELRQKDGKDIWLFGGGGLIDHFIKEDIIDEYIVGIIPVILGKGRPLFLENNPHIELHLDEVTVDDGVPILRYTKRT